MERTLYLVFIDSEGKKRTVRVDNPRSDITETEVLAAMNLILSKQIFGGAALASTDSAYVVTTTTQDIDLELAV